MAYQPLCAIYYKILFIYIVSLPTVVEGDLKAPSSVATSPRFKGRALLFAGSLHLPLIRILLRCVLSKVASSTIFFWVCGRSWPRIEPRSPESLANTLTVMPIGQSVTRSYVYLFETAVEIESPGVKTKNFCGLSSWRLDEKVVGWLVIYVYIWFVNE